MATLFEKIIAREIPATIEYEDDRVIVIHDIQPVASTHLLVIPKTPIPTVNDVSDEHKELVGHMVVVARDIAKKRGIETSGYRLVTNVNEDAGQTVFHLHMHILGGEPLGAMTSKPAAATAKTARKGSTLWEAGFLLLASIGLAIGFNMMNTKGVPWVKKEYKRVAASDGDIEQFILSQLAEDTTTVAVAELPPEKTKSVGQRDTNKVSLSKSEVVVTKPVEQKSESTFTAQPGVIKEINIQQFQKLMAGKHFLIDARTPEAYAKGYIGNAVNFYGGEAEAQISELLARVPLDRVILIYCDGGEECELSHHIADVLKRFGYGPMFIYMGGWNEWKSKK